eukprot:CAMPEP_0194477268 /NCGR_PEP_ID=MMETSP0253-20130528/1045_1 /TAXON_ID=2966 /ORGANISM="Noctiluca scintillans" /LENGTH=40 /DNA_ID= /DNA_START= /DNA_END= /DNA_ORIENTATION=
MMTGIDIGFPAASNQRFRNKQKRTSPDDQRGGNDICRDFQ